MKMCPMNVPCNKSKKVQLLVMEGKEEKSIKVCNDCPLARQANLSSVVNDNCPVCKTEFMDLSEGKRLGCEFCYLFMEPNLKILLEKVQDGSTAHVGKTPTSKQEHLLLKFFKKALDEHEKENPDTSKTCNKLQKFLACYF